MDEAPLLGARPGPHAEAAADLPALERASEAEFPAPSPAAAVQPERDELPVLRDAYLGAAAPGEEPPAAEDAAPPPAYSLRVLSSLLPAPLGAGVRVIPVSGDFRGAASGPGSAGEAPSRAGVPAHTSGGSQRGGARPWPSSPRALPLPGFRAGPSAQTAREQACGLGPCCCHTAPRKKPA